MDADNLNACLCAALGISDMSTISEVRLEIKVSQYPELTIRRFVVDPGGLEAAAELIGFTVTTGNITAVDFVSH